MLPEKPPTYPFIIEVPILEDEAVDALHDFLLDLLTAFENQYFSQLHRYRMYVEKVSREAREENQSLIAQLETPADDELNDELPF